MSTELVSQQEMFGNRVVSDLQFIEQDGKFFIAGLEICRRLDYSAPGVQAAKIFERHRQYLEPHSVTTKLVATDGKKYEVRCYDEAGARFFIAKCNVPKADELTMRMIEAFIWLRDQSHDLSAREKDQIKAAVQEVLHAPLELLPGITLTEFERIQNETLTLVQARLGDLVDVSPDEVGTTIARTLEYLWSNLEQAFKAQLKNFPLTTANLIVSEVSAQFYYRVLEAFEVRKPELAAEQLGISVKQLTDWRTGVIPSPRILHKVAYLTGVSLHWLWTGEGQKFVNEQPKLSKPAKPRHLKPVS